MSRKITNTGGLVSLIKHEYSKSIEENDKINNVFDNMTDKVIVTRGLLEHISMITYLLSDLTQNDNYNIHNYINANSQIHELIEAIIKNI
jgi:hypothetical protein